MGLPVNSPAEQLGGRNVTHFDNPSTTRQTVYYPSGALSVAIGYKLTAGTAVSGQHMRVVYNAASDAHADGLLATAGAHDRLAYGDDISTGAASTDPITRIDVRTAQAASTETSYLQIIAAVQA